MAIMNGEYVFSLDIGTRTVIGVVGEYRDEVLNILGSDKIEHKKRAMYDGQIHDINRVAEIAKQVKENLEGKTGLKLSKVSIAAAGRSLKTVKSSVTVEMDISREIEKRDIKSAEIEAIQIAQKTLDEDSKNNSKYHCVGYSLVKSYLDDVLIENLEGHRGEAITLEVIATFLPYTVMNSLYSVMDRVGLEVANITLEPIAAMEVAIKQSLRLLNLVLVDIGAGTSDIAVTKDGAVFAYDMVPIAGDEITEAILGKYLLDYNEAERLKISLSESELVKFNDILGICHEKKSEEVLDEIDESIKHLAYEIGDRILNINGKPPSAVFLIGGGSQTPRLERYIAEKLELSEDRVAIRDASIIEGVEALDENLSGADGITPIGIAVNSVKSNYKDFIEIDVNGQSVKLFNSGTPKMLDLMLTIGYNPRNLIPKRGGSIEYYLNGEKQTVLGEAGDGAEIMANGIKVDLEYVLNDKDKVSIESATEGKVKSLKLEEILNFDKSINLNGDRIKLIKKARVNGAIESKKYEVVGGDRIDIEEIQSLGDLLSSVGMSFEGANFYNETENLSLDHIFRDNENIVWEPRKAETVNTQIDEIESKNIEKRAEFKLDIVLNGERKSIFHNKSSFKFVDIFDHIEFDTSEPKGSLNLVVNGEKAEYMRKIEDGDIVEIYWGVSET